MSQPSLTTLTWFESAQPTLLLSLTVQLPLCKIQFFQKELDLNCGGNSRDTKLEGWLLDLEKFNQLFSRHEEIHSKQHTNEHPQTFFEVSYSKVWILKLCPSSPGYHEIVLEISCKKEKKWFEPFQASSQHLDQDQNIRRILCLKRNYRLANRIGNTDYKQKVPLGVQKTWVQIYHIQPMWLEANYLTLIWLVLFKHRAKIYIYI